MKKILSHKTSILVGLFAVVALFSNCHSDHGHDSHLIERLKASDTALSYEVMNHLIDTTMLRKVHSKLNGVEDFHIQARSGEITSYPCSNCHNQKLSTIRSLGAQHKKAHWDLELVHASDDAMNCTTCHGNGKMDDLTSLTGETIDFDDSYKLCGQCHSSQLDDWFGGAHGKQRNGWKPPRVATSCVECHNPHKPGFEQRFPARYNTQHLDQE